VVALDGGRGPLERHALDHVRVQRPLGQILRLPQGLGLPLEEVDELVPDDLALLLRLGHPPELLEEEVAGLHVAQVQVEVVAEGAHHLLRLAFPQDPVVHEDAR